MDLHSGLPYWILKDSLFDFFNPLEKDYKTEVAIIGSGITGALVAHELCEAGIACAVFDKRTIATGSSAASTAQLQYEIDTPLHRLVKLVGEEHAVAAFKDCLQSISDIEAVFKKKGIDADFQRVPTVYYTTNKKGVAFLKKEYEIRKKYGLPVEYLDKADVKKYQGIEAQAALKNHTSAQMDAYKGAVELLSYHYDKKQLDLFTHTRIEEAQRQKDGYVLYTESGYKVRCKYVIVAAGFESGQFLPREVMNLLSTYAIISQPVHAGGVWPHRSLIWNTDDPYLYMRTTKDNRMIVGGGDEDFEDPVRRDDLLRDKIRFLERKFKRLYPHIDFKTEMAWCGTFSSTADGLPFIGPYTPDDHMLFALGYGGNGITFSMIAAQLLTNIISGKKDDRLDVYGFHRQKKQ